jgi:hypothetical protein
MPLAARRGEVLASARFVEVNRLSPGDTLAALINGRWERLTLVGVALSPEYVYAGEPGAFLTDERHYGVSRAPPRFRRAGCGVRRSPPGSRTPAAPLLRSWRSSA